MSRSAAAFFCEDIRQEEGNKLSYMGIFSGDMILPDLPAVLPKFCVVIRVVTPADQPLSQLKILVITNEDTLFESDVPQETLRTKYLARVNTALPLPDPHDYRAPYPSNVRLFHLTFTNVAFDSETAVMVRLVTEAEILRAGAIRVSKAAAALGEKVSAAAHAGN